MIDPRDLTDSQRKRGLNLLLAQTFMAWAGFFVVVPLISVHYVDRLGWAAASIGFALAVRQFTQQGFTFLSGALADIVGAKWLICIGMLLRTVGFLTMAFADTYPRLLLSLLLAAIGGALFESPRSAAIAALTEESERRRFFSIAGVLGGMGIVLGTQLGALLISRNFDYVAYAGAASFFLIFIGSVILLPNVAVASAGGSFTSGLSLAIRDRPFLVYNALLIGYWFLWAQFYISVPLAGMGMTGNESAVAWIYAVNSAVTVLLGYFLPRWLEGRLEAYQMLLIGIAISSVSIGTIALVHSFVPFLISIFFISLGTVLVRPGEQTVTAGLANPSARGSYFGVASIGIALGGGSGNYLGGVLYDLGMTHDIAALPWLIFAGLGLVAVVGLWRLGETMLVGRITVHRPSPLSPSPAPATD